MAPSEYDKINANKQQNVTLGTKMTMSVAVVQKSIIHEIKIKSAPGSSPSAKLTPSPIAHRMITL